MPTKTVIGPRITTQSPVSLWASTSMAFISPLAFRSSAGRHFSSALSTAGECAVAAVRIRNLSIEHGTPQRSERSIARADAIAHAQPMLRRLALFVLLPLQACAGDGLRSLKPLEIATSPYQDIVSSSLTGSLMYESGCLLFRDDETKARFLPVWPQDSVFNGTAVLFHQPAKADERVVLGEEFLMEGRAVEWAEMDSDHYARFERQCSAKPFYVSAVRPAN